MKTKFGKKLLALFLAAVMSLTVFSGLISVQAEGRVDYHDDSLSANALAWVELTDEQTAEALLDYLDDILSGVNLTLSFSQSIVVATISLDITIDSVSGLIDAVRQIDSLLDSYGSLAGLTGIDLSALADLSYTTDSSGYPACGRDYRANYTAKEILTALVETISDNMGFLTTVLEGDFSVNWIGELVLDAVLGTDDIYAYLQSTLEDALGISLPDNYEDNLIYQLVVGLLGGMTDWFTDEEITHMQNLDSGYELDTMLFQALSENLLQQINVNVTYADGTTSQERYAAGNTDPNLCYTVDGNVYIFQYDENSDGEDDVNLTLTPATTLWDFAYDALEVAWKTVLSATLNQLNYNSSDYDNAYATWYLNQGYTWDYDDVASNYAATYVEAWAADEDIDLDEVEESLTFDRDLVDDPSYNWRDIDSQTLFQKLCRSPLMAYYFGGETGVLNTNFKYTGTPNMDAFFENDYSSYDSILAGINDFLIAAVQDFLPEFDASVLTTINTTDASTIADTLVSNALIVVQYIADATDANILSGFYNTYGADAELTEETFEEATVPFLIACLENNLDDLVGQIHKDKWDACTDFEAVAAVALQEYLAYILPDMDYSSFFTTDDNGYYTVTLDSVLAMCRDAVGYVIMQYVPVTDAYGYEWSIYNVDAAQTYEEQVNEGTDIFSLLNSVVCYYADDKGLATLLGCCDANGNSTVSLDNSLWENIDVIANTLFPVLGELQYGSSASYGDFDSEELIWNDLVLGLFDVGEDGGLTNIVYRLATILNADPLKTTGVDTTIYNLLQDLFNGVLNARYTSQTYYGQDVIPDATSSNPFHDLIQIGTIMPALNMLVENVKDFAGAGSYEETIWDGAMYIVYVLSGFIDGFVPQLSDYTVGDLDVSTEEFVTSSYIYGDSFTIDITLENTGYGLNRFIRTATGEVGGYDLEELDRSYIRVTNITSDKGTFSYSSLGTIDPEDTLSVTATGSLSSSDFGGSADTVVAFTVTYYIVDSDGNAYADEYASAFTKTFYYYVTTEQDWYSLTYGSSYSHGFTEDWGSASTSAQSGNYSSRTGNVTDSSSHVINFQYPNDVVVRTSEIEEFVSYFAVVTSSSWTNYTDKAVDAIVAYSDDYGGSDYFAVTCNSDGDIINVWYYDYFICETETVIGEDGTSYEVNQTDENGDYVGSWSTTPVSKDEIESLMAEDSRIVDYRYHVIVENEDIVGYTFADGYTVPDYIADQNENGTYNVIYLQKDSSENYKTVIDYSVNSYNDVSLSAGVAGLVLSYEKHTYDGGSVFSTDSVVEQYEFISWDGETEVTGTDGEVTMNFQVISSSTATFSVDIIVVDDSDEMTDLTASYLELYDILSNYTEEDFADPDVYDYLYNTSVEALANLAAPLTANNAARYSSTKADMTVYESTTDVVGDVAYMPADSSYLSSGSLSDLLLNAATHNGLNFVTAYTDSSGTTYYENPIYSNTEVTNAYVTDTGEDITIDDETYDIYRLTTPSGYIVSGSTETAVYDEVVYIRLSGESEAKWHLLNDVQYAQEWADNGSGTGIFLGEPYLADMDEQATDSSGNLLYNEITFSYATSNNTSTSSAGTWYVKYADTEYRVIDDADARGEMAISADKAEYLLTFVYDYISVSVAQDIFEDVYLLRNDLINTNFDVINYEQMASAGRLAEAMLDIDLYYDYYYVSSWSGESELLFGSLASEAEDALEAYNTEYGTSYTLSDLTAEVDYDRSEASSSSTTFELNEALRLFNLYLAQVTERGYIGDRLEEEILCAANGKTDSGTATSWVRVEADVENASYTDGSNTYTADNNPDGVIYTEESWAAFIEALYNASEAAYAAEIDPGYDYYDEGIYEPENKDDYIYQVTDVYALRTALMRAENNLTEVEAEEDTDVTYTYTYANGTSTTVTAEAGVEPTAPENTASTVASNENGTHTVTTYSWPAWVEGTTEYTEVAATETVDCTMQEVSRVTATCVTPGSVTSECSVCSYTNTETGETDPTNHEGDAFTDEDSYVAPTKGEAGKEADTVCSACGEVITEGAEIAALGVQITVEGTDGLGTVTLNGDDVEFGSTTTVDYESGYTLVATAADNAEFVGWSVNGKIVSTSETYTTAAYADMTFVAVFNEVDTEFTVTFMDSFGMVLGTISSDALGELTEADLPDVYTYLGYTFTGWSMSIDEINALDSAAVVTAQYDIDSTVTYTVTAEGATITVNGDDYADTAQVRYDSYVTVKADGATVWYVNGAKAAYGDEYSFCVTSDVTVTFGTDAIDAEPTVTAISQTYIEETGKVRFLASRSVPEGYTVVESGFLYGKDLDDAEEALVLENVVDGNGVYVYNNSSTSNEGQFAVTFGIASKTGIAYVRAYVVVADSEGNTSVYYADVQSYDYDA